MVPRHPFKLLILFRLLIISVGRAFSHSSECTAFATIGPRCTMLLYCPFRVMIMYDRPQPTVCEQVYMGRGFAQLLPMSIAQIPAFGRLKTT